MRILSRPSLVLLVVSICASAPAMEPRIIAPNAGAHISLSSSVIVSGGSEGAAEGEIACRWSLAEEGVGTQPAIPQEPGYDDDGFSISNCVRNVRFGSIPGVRAGAARIVLEVRPPGVERKPSAAPARVEVPVTFVSGQFAAVGISPGVALPGDEDLVLYGDGFGATTQLVIHGPVYSLEAPAVPLCELALKRCPAMRVAAAVNSRGTELRFALPGSATPGIYQVVATQGGRKAGRWLMVESPRKVRPIPVAGQNPSVWPIYTGQEVRGTFVPRHDPSGTFWDYNLYYFIATAGSRVSVSLERVDTSKSWYHPDEIDPELSVIGPSNSAEGALWNEDVVPGGDLNSRIKDACLPQTGFYLIVAATTKGYGEYVMRFSCSPAPPENVGKQAVNLVGSDPMEINWRYPYSIATALLDPRGRLLGDAPVNFEPESPPGLRIPYMWRPGMDFLGGSGTRTTPRGIASLRCQLVRRGEGTVTETAQLIDDALLAIASRAQETCGGSDRTIPKAFVFPDVHTVDAVTGEIQLRSYEYKKVNR